MIQSLQWDGLRTLWDNIDNRSTPGWDAGKAFEYLVLRAFQLDGAQVRWPYTVTLFDEEVEQIDGAVHCLGLSCLVASKDFAGVHLNLERAKHFGRQFISDNQRFTAEMLRPYEYICKNGMLPFADGAKVNITPIAKLRNQLLRRPAGVVGLVFSRTGFTPPARNLSCFSSPQAILLWDGEEIKYALYNQNICELLILKYRGYIEYGLPDYDVRERYIQ